MFYDRKILSDPISYELFLGMTAEEIYRESRAQGKWLTTFIRQLWYERHGDRPLPDDVLDAWIGHIRETCERLGMDMNDHLCPVCGRVLPLEWTPEGIGD